MLNHRDWPSLQNSYSQENPVNKLEASYVPYPVSWNCHVSSEEMHQKKMLETPQSCEPVNISEPRTFEPYLQQLETMCLSPISMQDVQRYQQEGHNNLDGSHNSNISQSSSQEDLSTNSPSEKSLVHQLRQIMPVPPLCTYRIEAGTPDQRKLKRGRSRSKYGKFQDDMIIRLKRDGYSWAEIAELVGIDSPIAVRNRYQVIIGQQGNNNSSNWTAQNGHILQGLLDSAEIDKWNFIARELSKLTGKQYSPGECQDFIRHMLLVNPKFLGWTQERVTELGSKRTSHDNTTRTK